MLRVKVSLENLQLGLSRRERNKQCKLGTTFGIILDIQLTQVSYYVNNP